MGEHYSLHVAPSRRAPVQWESVLDADIRVEFEHYVRANGKRLVRTAYLLVGDWHTAEDLVQATLAGLVVSWRQLRDVGSLDAYVHRSLVNARTSRWRRRRLEPEPVAELPDLPVGDHADRHAMQAWLLGGLRTLSRTQRTVVVLRYFEDRSEEDVAGILGCSTSTVKTHAARGLDRLRSALGVDPPRSAARPPARLFLPTPEGGRHGGR